MVTHQLSGLSGYELVVFVVSDKEKGNVVALYLPTGTLKTFSGLQLLLRSEPTTYQLVV